MNVLLGILAVFSLCLAAGNGYYIARWFYRVRRCAHWPATTGKIVESETSVKVLGDPMLYLTKIVYNYEANGVQYVCDKYDTSGEFDSASLEQAEQMQRAYPVDATVPVYYNPANPAEAMLNRRNILEVKNSWVGVKFFTVFGLICLALLWADSIYLNFAFVGFLGLAALFHRWTRPMLVVTSTRPGKYFLSELRKRKSSDPPG
jgi:Protein of unknown function (DUF3592)